MSSLGPWRSLMNQEVEIESRTGLDAYGNPVYGPPRKIRARVSGQTRLVRTVAGDERVSTVTSYLAEVTGITIDDRITLPADFVPRQPTIIAVKRPAGPDGPIHHEEVMT